MREIGFDEWQASRERNAAWCRRLDAGLPPFQRTRLRDEDEATALRTFGTPEALIGPVATSDLVDAERAQLIEFARNLRRNVR